ncbi:MAG TPA: glycosyltransferase, partial [Gemmatimonadales bacterium]
DQRPRLQAVRFSPDSPRDRVPHGGFVLCVVGGGHDGAALVEAFARAELPPGMSGVVVNGPLMGPADRRRARRIAQQRPDLTILDFVEDTTPLIERADRVIAMGGYNTVCEVLSFEKHALIVPRVHPEPEQWVRAERMREFGLFDVLHPDQLTAAALSDWLARDLGPARNTRRVVDMGALRRVPRLVSELVTAESPAVTPLPLRASGGSRS